MNKGIPTAPHFDCIAVKEAWISAGLTQRKLDLGDDTWLFVGAPFDLPDEWQRWVGSVRAAELAESDLFIIAFWLDGDSMSVDAETQRERYRRAFHILCALALHGTQDYDQMLHCTGSSDGGSVGIGSTSEVPGLFLSSAVSNLETDQTILDSAMAAASGLRNIFADGDYLRLRRGFMAWLRGKRESEPPERLHQFARAIEAVMKCDPGRTERQFVHRGQTFIGASPDNANLLKELFKLRSSVEHMNEMEDALDPWPPGEKEKVALLRTSQAELLASHLYLRILKDKAKRELFSDPRIADFWARPDHEKKEIWGEQIDLAQETRTRYDPSRLPLSDDLI